MTNSRMRGSVKPWVKQAADEVGNKFGITTIYGVGSREVANSDHPRGLALDYMVPVDSVKGDQVAAYMQQNWQHYSVQYIIWKQHIWNMARPKEGWRAMPDRGSVTANHRDHVHVSFQSREGMITVPIIGGTASVSKDAVKDALDPLSGIKNAIGFLTDSHNWLRVGMFTLGFAMILVALVMLGISVGVKPATVRKVVKNVRPLRSRNA